MSDIDGIIAKLRAHRDDLEALGVAHASVFGSAARGDTQDGSDVDIAIRFADGARLKGAKYFGAYQRIMDRLSDLLDGADIDLADEAMMAAHIQSSYQSERVRVF